MKAKSDKQGALFGALGKMGGTVLGNMFGQGGLMSAASAGGTMSSIGGALSTAFSFLGFSDPDLKTNIRRIGTHNSGLALYKWDWNDTANKLGVGSQSNVGVMADEAKEKFPNAVRRHPSGYLEVRYERLQ